MTDSFDPEKLTPLQLSKKLLEKHRRFMENYQREFDARHKISVMEEKRDLLNHWISSAEEDGSNGYEKYLKEKESVDSRILSLKNELQSIILQDPNNESKTESKRRYSFLEEQIDFHKEAIDQWNNKIMELSKVKAKKEKKVEEKKKVKVKKAKPKAKKSRSKKRKAKKK